jgi:hypothetical protein
MNLSPVSRRVRAPLLVLLMVCTGLLAACGTLPGAQLKPDPVTEYGAAIRWNEFERASAFLDPAATLPPLTDLERERMKQIEVTGYEVKSQHPLPDGGMAQEVEIRVVNKHTQLERKFIDHQVWRYDAAAKGYVLSSGLPDFGAER